MALPALTTAPSPLLDEGQLAVVNAHAAARQLVEAGPGCGKTHVACARVAALLRAVEPPDGLLLLSFTRTAVHELRMRIARMAGGVSPLAGGVELRTIDSFAWRVACGSSEVSPGTYEDSMLVAVAALERARLGQLPELRAYVDRFSHVLVDEAQDLVGTRALLVLGFLNMLRPDTGWTVFLDPAQAIYGWSSDAGGQPAQMQFIDHLADLQGTVEHRSLLLIHRTDRADMIQLMSMARAGVLDLQVGRRLQAVRDTVAGRAVEGKMRAADLPALVNELGPDQREQALFLFRRRVDALMGLSYLRDAGIPCRLRVGGTPRIAAAWLSVVANDLARRGSRLSRVHRFEFERTWKARCEGSWLATSCNIEDAWSFLRRVGRSGQDAVDLGAVASRLAMTSVPDEVFSRDLGPRGPILGTIHGSKGREARRVVLCLGDDVAASDTPDQGDEEARVLYVGLSRAIDRIDVRQMQTTRCSYVENRAWHHYPKQRGLQVEIGREGDVDPVWPMCMGDSLDAGLLQERLETYTEVTVVLDVQRDPDNKTWCVRTREEPGHVIGALSLQCVDQLGEVVRACSGKKSRAPMIVRHLTWLDVTTVAVRDDHPLYDRLSYPWNESRMWLAPVVAGMGWISRYW